MPDTLFDEVEAKYAPPDHPVFQLTPPPFDRRANLYYDHMGQPPVSSTTFWTIYQDLLHFFQTMPERESQEDVGELQAVLEKLPRTEEHISNEDKIELLPGLPPIRAGGVVVGDGADEDNSVGSIYADLTDSELELDSEEEDGYDSSKLKSPDKENLDDDIQEEFSIYALLTESGNDSEN